MAAGSVRHFDVSFGSSKTGLTTVGYRFYGVAGLIGIRATAGVFEIGGGAYGLGIKPSVAAVGIQWDTGEATPIFAHEDFATMLLELWREKGLDIDNPMTVTPATRAAGSAQDQTISGDGITTTTVTRDP